jgi:hypothetical protein
MLIVAEGSEPGFQGHRKGMDYCSSAAPIHLLSQAALQNLYRSQDLTPSGENSGLAVGARGEPMPGLPGVVSAGTGPVVYQVGDLAIVEALDLLE